MTIGEKIIAELNKQGKSQKSLAQYIGVSDTAIGKWKTKPQDIKFENVVKASEFLGISLNYLAYGKEPSIPTEYKKLILSYQKLSPENQQMALRLLDTMYDVQTENENRSQIETTTIKCSPEKVSAGKGFELYDTSDWKNWETKTVLKTSYSDKASYALIIDGDSMEPKFHSNDVVLVKQQDSVDIGEICIYTIAGQGFIKKFGGDRLISLNKEYKDIMLSDYNVDEIRCCGLVLGTTEIVD